MLAEFVEAGTGNDHTHKAGDKQAQTPAFNPPGKPKASHTGPNDGVDANDCVPILPAERFDSRFHGSANLTIVAALPNRTITLSEMASHWMPER
jgi:hypothetical protein